MAANLDAGNVVRSDTSHCDSRNEQENVVAVVVIGLRRFQTRRRCGFRGFEALLNFPKLCAWKCRLEPGRNPAPTYRGE